MITFYALILPAMLMKSISAYTQERNNLKLESPIKHLEFSLAASAAHGTVTAIRVNDNSDDENSCIVIVSRSPSSPSSVSKLSFSSLSFGEIENEESAANAVSKERFERSSYSLNEHIYLPRGPVSHTLGREDEGMLHVLHEGAVVATTGFAADARYLVQCSTRDISRHEQIYGVNPHSFPSLKRIVVDKIANRMSRVAFAAEGRPFGVQVLVVGKGNRTDNSSSRPISPLLMYTIDPSGGWRQWKGCATVIGRNAEVIKHKMYSNLAENLAHEVVKLPTTIEDAAEAGIRAIIEAEPNEKKEDLYKNKNLSDQFQVLIVSPFERCAAMNSEQIRNICIRCITK